MKSSHFAELIALIGFVIGAVISTNSSGGLYQFGALLSLGSLIWYFKWGNKLSGWVGETDAQIERKIKQLEKEAEVLSSAKVSPERYKKEAELSGKLIALQRKLADCKAATAELGSDALLMGTSKAGLCVGETSEASSTEDKTLEVFLPHDPKHAPAVELLTTYKGYRAIFLKGTQDQQTAKLDEIMTHINELRSINTWFERLQKMSVAERAPLQQHAEQTMKRRVEILTQILRPF